ARRGHGIAGTEVEEASFAVGRCDDDLKVRVGVAREETRGARRREAGNVLVVRLDAGLVQVGLEGLQIGRRACRAVLRGTDPIDAAIGISEVRLRGKRAGARAAAATIIVPRTVVARTAIAVRATLPGSALPVVVDRRGRRTAHAVASYRHQERPERD